MPELYLYRAAYLAARHFTNVITAEIDGTNEYAPAFYVTLCALGVTCVGYEPPEDIAIAKSSGDIILADERQVYYLTPETTEISPLLKCSPNMEDDICEAEDGEDTDFCSYDILRVEVDNSEDAVDFCAAASMSELPVMFFSENEIALKTALLLYNGVAMIDKSTSIPVDVVEYAAKKYGAVIY
jgi:hypothetical protein